MSCFHTFGSTWLMKWILFSGPSLSPYCSSPFLHAQLLRAVSGALLQSARSHRCPAQLINSSQQKIVVITARGAAGRPAGLGAHSFPARGRHWPGVSITPSSHVELTRAGNRGQLSPLQPGSVATSTPSCTPFFQPAAPLGAHEPPETTTHRQPACVPQEAQGALGGLAASPPAPPTFAAPPRLPVWSLKPHGVGRGQGCGTGDFAPNSL